MTSRTCIQWTRKEDERWAAVFELHLVTEYHPQKNLADQALSEVHEMVTEAGRSAEDLLGDPRQYAASVAADRLDETHAGKRDLRGATAGERFTTAVVMAGFMGLTLSAVRWISDGLWVKVSFASSAAAGALAAGAVILCLAVALRAAGRMRAMWACLGAFIVMVACGMIAATVLPQYLLFSLPIPVLLAVSVAVMVGAHWLPDATADRWFSSRHGGDDAAWMGRLDGLLRGRHGIPVKDAREYVTEVRSHLSSAECRSAQEEFGDVETYAARLANGPRREQRIQRRKAHAAGVFALLLVVATFDRLLDPDVTSFWFWLATLAVAYALVDAVMLYGDFRRRGQ
ncbi:hypothetical protein [Streptomyces sp. NPDC046261]|uniref:hypothetical protein n=1 Tax=Streptomyces sp. NPDC046261 TaxID=3157200 RepID=UPI0033E4B6F0